MSRERHIEVQRARLATVRTVLAVAAFAVINDVDGDYDCGDLFALAHQMVEATLNALDSVELDRAAKAQAVADGLRDAAEACTDGPLRKRLEQGTEVIEQLLSASSWG